jgi:signal transduction histidine kinase
MRADLAFELQDDLTEVRASRSRLMAAVTTERRRLERDLHDGARQQLVAVGMRLRSLQLRRLVREVRYRSSW